MPVSNDNGGVHTNSGICNQTYYLAIEGGTNRTSGLTVKGVGQPTVIRSRRSMYRGLHAADAVQRDYSVARAVTIQAATDLYGGDSAADHAITDAWTAVGVN